MIRAGPMRRFGQLAITKLKKTGGLSDAGLVVTSQAGALKACATAREK
jgi:hypothetical protein